MVAPNSNESSTASAERFERDAPFYQVTQDGQLLFSLAQAINRIREGWQAPETTSTDEQDDAPAQIPTPETPAQETLATTDTTVQPPVPVVSAVQRLAAHGLPWQRALDILVIDDSHFSRAAIAEALVKVGFSVDTVESGEAGVRRATEKLFDVALVDFEMPGMRGPETLRRLRALGAQSPSVLVMLTSRTGSVDRLRAKFAGCDAYLTKPTRMQEFLATLREFAAQGKLSRS